MVGQPFSAIIISIVPKRNLENIRHSLAHLLAAAVLRKFPNAKLGIGPVIEDGFYYDFKLPRSLTPEDLKEFEKTMRDLIRQKLTFSGQKVKAAEAKRIFKNQPFKLDLIKEFIKEKKELTVYKTGEVFEDLCRGGHVKNTGEINPDSFLLDRIAGAYWRGNEKNPQLQRIYGIAFATKKELNKYLKRREEAKRRDHRELGQRLELFTFSDLVGAGLPLFTPKGVIIRNEIEKFLEELQLPRGYQKVWIPHLAKKELYIKSGHWEKFGDDIFKVSSKAEEKFVLKPMNCPHHTQIYASSSRSWRDLPIRYFEVTEMYRDEKPGQLQGLTRVRAITIDDAHCFCRPDQVEKEVENIYGIIKKFYSVFGMKLIPRLSKRDSAHPEKYIGNPKKWDEAEAVLRSVLRKKYKNFQEIEGEAAFYGPKIDFEAEDVLGRKWQLATIQVDFAMPERFKLEYIDKNGERKRVVMLHRAISGSLERFMAILLEHYAGALPLWLSPVQVAVLAVSKKHQKYAENIFKLLKEHKIRAELTSSDETLGKRIREAELQKIPYMLVLGDKEMKAKNLSVRERHKEKTSAVSIETFLKKIAKEIAERKNS